MQIDNKQQAIQLTKRIKASLPMRVRPTKQGLKGFQEKAVNITTQSWFNVKDALYSGDEGGILLALDPYSEKAKQAVVASITHLVVDPNHELASEIKEYQRIRIRKLAMENQRGFAKELLSNQASKPRKKGKGFG